MRFSFFFIILFLTGSCTYKYIVGEEDEQTQNLPQSRSHENPPNFIIVFVDDVGYGDLSCFGNPTIKTPHLDAMGVEGQRWTQFYSADPVCTPSRAGLLTGRYPIRNGMTSSKRGVLFPDSPGGLPQGEITIAEMLKQKDYATGIVGKWHLGHLPKHLPTTQGFDYYWGIPYSNDMDLVPGSPSYWEESADPMFVADPNNYNVPIIENLTEVERPADQHTITTRYAEKAVSFINDNADKPFFLYVPHSMGHIPMFAHPDRVGTSKRGLYGDSIEEIDWGVGEIVKALKANDIDDNTIVVFTSDNGPWLRFRTHGGSSGPLRAGKGTSFEGGQRVPTIIWGPGIVKPALVTELGSTLDLMKTIASLAGVDMPDDRKMDSYDLSGLLTGETGISPRDHFYYWAYGRLHGIRFNNYKMHIHSMEEILYWNPVELDQPLLYDIERDISEKYDLYDKMPEKAKELQNMMKRHLDDTADSLPDNLAARMIPKK